MKWNQKKETEGKREERRKKESDNRKGNQKIKCKGSLFLTPSFFFFFFFFYFTEAHPLPNAGKKWSQRQKREPEGARGRMVVVVAFASFTLSYS
jgi:hypothetical protein